MWDLPEYLVRKRAKVETMRERLRQPDSAPTPLRALVRVAAGSGVRPARIRDFQVITDSGAGLGGFELGPTAPELLLAALGSCLAHSFVVVAADRGVAFESLEVEVTGQIDYRGTLAVADDAHIPPSDLAYHVRYTSSADPAAVAEVWREVERLCPVLQALLRPTEVRGMLSPT